MSLSPEPNDNQFSLRWDNYHSSLSMALETLRSNEDFVDVTLVCEGKSLQSHRILLSACSPYFHQIFKSNPCPHPVIILRETKYTDLLAILEYVYRGEVSIDQFDLDSFLLTANVFGICGLSNDTANGSTVSEFSSEKVFNYNKSFKRKRKRIRLVDEAASTLSEDLASGERNSCANYDSNPIGIDICNVFEDIITGDVSAPKMESEDIKGPNITHLFHCGVKFEDEDAFRAHIDRVHPEYLDCLYCSKAFSNRKSLNRHNAMHEGRTKCNICFKVFARVDNLRVHLRQVHNQNT